MGLNHIVEPGEHLSGIAAQFGFSSFLTIWDHPENTELKKLRKNPNILMPGDRLFIPDREQKEEKRSTEARHRFEAKREQLILRVKVLSLDDKPKGEPCTLTGSGVQNQMFDVGDNVLAGLIPADVKKAELFFPSLPGKDESDVKLPLSVGGLNPITEPSGQRQRLNNLGYFAGFSESNRPQLIWAIEEFQCDHLEDIQKLNPKKTKPDGIVEPEGTQKVLEKVYGV